MVLLLAPNQQQQATTHDAVGQQQQQKPNAAVLPVTRTDDRSGDTAQHQSNTAESSRQQSPRSPWNIDRIISVMAVIVTAIYLGFTVLIWGQMVRANKHAEMVYETSKRDAEASRALALRQLEAYERAWITVEFTLTGYSFVGDNLKYIGLACTFNNVGKSVATDICFVADILPIPIGTPYHDFIREKVAALPYPTDPATFTLFPGGKWEYKITDQVISQETIDTYKFVGIDDGKPHIALALLGKVFYRYQNSHERHETQFCYVFVDPEGRLRFTLDSASEKVVFLQKYVGDYAT